MKNNSIAISVVICTRNRFDYLKKCVKSLLKQSHKPKEIIIVDDNSEKIFTPGELLKNISLLNRISNDVPIIIARNKKKYGTVASRNAGIALARGNVIAFLDDDGYAHSDWLKNLSKNYANENIVGVGGPVIEIGREMETPKKPIKRLAYITRRGDVVTNYRIKNVSDVKKLPRKNVKFFQGGNMSFRKNALLEIGGFDKDFKGTAYREETDLGLRMRKKGLLAFEPNALTYHNTAMIGGSRETDNLNLGIFLYWYFRNTTILFLKHFKSIDAFKKIFYRTKKQLYFIIEGKTGLNRNYLLITSKFDAIYSTIIGTVTGIIYGFLNKHKKTLDRLYLPEPEKVMKYTFVIEKKLTHILHFERTNYYINKFKRFNKKILK